MDSGRKPSKKSKKKRKTKKKKKPIDDETARIAAENAKRELVEFLATKTDLTEEELLISYDEFHENYPSGEINKKEFLAQSKAGMFLAEALFRVFDEDNSGNLDFSEFIQANSVKNLETPEAKLGWMFDAYDADGGGTVDTDEITNIVVGLFRLAGIEEDQDLLAACVYDVIEAVDQEGDGDISKDEFVENAMKCKFIFNMLKSKRT